MGWDVLLLFYLNDQAYLFSAVQITHNPPEQLFKIKLSGTKSVHTAWIKSEQ